MGAPPVAFGGSQLMRRPLGSPVTSTMRGELGAIAGSVNLIVVGIDVWPSVATAKTPMK